MPFEIVKKPNQCYSVVNTLTDRIYSECTSLRKAQAQKRILDNYETSWKGMINQTIKGQTFKNRQEYIDTMKRLSQEYQMKF
jgi:hypothetical protein